MGPIKNLKIWYFGYHSSKSGSQLRRAEDKAEKRRLADLAEQERRARRSAEKAAGLGADSLSLEENVVAQAVALGA